MQTILFAVTCNPWAPKPADTTPIEEEPMQQAEEVDETQNLVIEVEIVEDDSEEEPEPVDETKPVDVDSQMEVEEDEDEPEPASKVSCRPLMLSREVLCSDSLILHSPRPSQLKPMSTMRCQSRRTTSQSLPPSRRQRNPNQSHRKRSSSPSRHQSPLQMTPSPSPSPRRSQLSTKRRMSPSRHPNHLQRSPSPSPSRHKFPNLL